MKLEKKLVQWCAQRSVEVCQKNVVLAECIVLTPDGFAVSSGRGESSASDSKAARLATITSSLHAVSHAIAQEAAIGPEQFIIVDAQGGKLVVCAFTLQSHQLVLAMLGTASAMPGSILVLARNFITEAGQMSLENGFSTGDSLKDSRAFEVV